MALKSLGALFCLSCMLLSCVSTKAKYYQHINAAYAHISEKNYKKSVRHFKKALRQIDQFVGTDQYNAFQSAIKANDIPFASYNALKLAEKGMCYSFFQQYPKLVNDLPLNTKLSNICSNRDRFNGWYADSLYRMMQEDQTIHGNENTHHLRRYTDSLNFEEFKKLVQQYGYPSESRIGIECTPALKGFSPLYHDILLTHFAQNDFTGLNELLRTALDSVYISPYDFLAYNALTTKGRIVSGGEIFYLNGAYYVEKPKSGSIDEINRVRKKYGLWPTGLHVNLIKNYKNGNIADFRVKRGVSTGIPFPPEIIQKYLIKIGEDAVNNK